MFKGDKRVNHAPPYQDLKRKEKDKVKKLYVAAFAIMFLCVACITIQSEEARKTENLLAGAPYSDSGMGKRKLVDENYLLMMQVALQPGQMVPRHNANSNVHIIILDGEVVINMSGKDITAKKGDLVPVAFKTLMNIENKSQSNATFVIIKTPKPGQMGKDGVPYGEMKSKPVAVPDKE